MLRNTDPKNLLVTTYPSTILNSLLFGCIDNELNYIIKDKDFFRIELMNSIQIFDILRIMKLVSGIV
jgi:hypothetical protein